MTKDDIKCPKCGKEVKAEVCPWHSYSNCPNCFGVGFVAECRDCCWIWDGSPTAAPAPRKTSLFATPRRGLF